MNENIWSHSRCPTENIFTPTSAIWVHYTSLCFLCATFDWLCLNTYTQIRPLSLCKAHPRSPHPTTLTTQTHTHTHAHSHTLTHTHTHSRHCLQNSWTLLLLAVIHRMDWGLTFTFSAFSRRLIQNDLQQSIHTLTQQRQLAQRHLDTPGIKPATFWLPVTLLSSVFSKQNERIY